MLRRGGVRGGKRGEEKSVAQARTGYNSATGVRNIREECLTGGKRWTKESERDNEVKKGWGKIKGRQL